MLTPDRSVLLFLLLLLILALETVSLGSFVASTQWSLLCKLMRIFASNIFSNGIVLPKRVFLGGRHSILNITFNNLIIYIIFYSFYYIMTLTISYL